MSGERRDYCRDCQGHGSVWTCDAVDGFERNRRWETCERCDGDGYEPKTEPQEDEDQNS